MPRGALLGAWGLPHHVMVRGIERRAILRDDRNRRDSVTRVTALTETQAWTMYAPLGRGREPGNLFLFLPSVMPYVARYV